MRSPRSREYCEGHDHSSTEETGGLNTALELTTRWDDLLRPEGVQGTVDSRRKKGHSMAAEASMYAVFVLSREYCNVPRLVNMTVACGAKTWTKEDGAMVRTRRARRPPFPVHLHLWFNRDCNIGGCSGRVPWGLGVTSVDCECPWWLENGQ
jgi:hypothetical protein